MAADDKFQKVKENMQNMMSVLKPIIDFDNFRAAPRLDQQAQAALVKPNPRLEHAVSNSLAKGLPPINVLPLAGQHLSVLAQSMQAKNVLELGTLGGYSSICFAEAGAKVTSIEIDPKHRDVALENVEGLDVEVLLGAALDVLPKLAAEGRQFDMVFIDADFEDHWEHFDWAVKLTRPNGCIFFDDVIASMFKHGETELNENSIITKVGNDERVKATLVPLVASWFPLLETPVFNGYILATVLPH